MSSLFNLELFSVGAASAAILFLGFTVFFNDKKNKTGQAFIIFSILTVAWGITNYAAREVHSPDLSLQLFRIAIFFAVWHVFSLLHLFWVFPQAKFEAGKSYKFGLIPLVLLASITNLTPLVFSKIGKVAEDGKLLEIINGPGIIIFSAVLVCLVIGAISLLIKKTIAAKDVEKKQLKFVLTGTSITFSLLILFNFVLPAFLNNTNFIPLGPVFIFPFVVFTFYAISKHHLLNVKVIATEIIAFILSMIALSEILLSKDLLNTIFRFGIFSLILGFSILLIQSVVKEVKQREELQELSKILESKNKELESLSRFKSQMLSLAAHQIKAPLATIKGFSTIIADGLYGAINEKIKETMKKIRFSADDLINLINSLLDVRHIEEGKMNYNFQPVKIKGVAFEAFEIVKFAAEQKGVNLTFECLTDPSISADPQKLKQVLQNLIDNAVKYTPQGFVKVEIKEEPELSGEPVSVLFSVIDSGLGIPADLLPHLFQEEFVRDDRIKKEILGTGLGLYIANRIIKDHQGKIWAESDGPGKGSRFFVKLRKI